MVRSWSSFGMLPLRHDVEHRRVQVRQQLQALDGAERQGERVGDGLLVPALRLQRLDGAPDVDAVHRGADQVLRHRAHGVGGLVGVAHEHVDAAEAGGDRGLDAAVAGDDDDQCRRRLRVTTRRLDDADRV